MSFPIVNILFPFLVSRPFASRCGRKENVSERRLAEMYKATRNGSVRIWKAYRFGNSCNVSKKRHHETQMAKKDTFCIFVHLYINRAR